MRKGPSTRAKKIGIAPRGTTFEVKVRKGEWVAIDDPASGGTAWIHSSLTKRQAGSEADNREGAGAAVAFDGGEFIQASKPNL
jgi:hypothetical protein